MGMTRMQVYDLIDDEREYQIGKWGDDSSPHKQSVEAWICYMQDYLDEARHIISRESDVTAKPKAMANIRKITAMGVASMEAIGAPARVL